MNIKEQISIEQKALMTTIRDAIFNFQETTGLSVEDLKVVTSQGADSFGRINNKFLYVDVIIKL